MLPSVTSSNMVERDVTELTKGEILDRFDQLVSAGTIQYDAAPQVVNFEEQGFKVPANRISHQLCLPRTMPAMALTDMIPV
jgi:hypothetical protein